VEVVGRATLSAAPPGPKCDCLTLRTRVKPGVRSRDGFAIGPDPCLEEEDEKRRSTSWPLPPLCLVALTGNRYLEAAQAL
jgi:hypothetical protein